MPKQRREQALALQHYIGAVCYNFRKNLYIGNVFRYNFRE